MKDFKENRVMLSDSYKYSHYLQYPKGTVNMYDYAEARSLKEYDKTLFFGLQMIWKKYFSTPLTIDEVEEAKSYAKPHGIPFNEDGWLKIVKDYEGRLPVTIKAVPEGLVIPNKTVLFTVELTKNDRDIFWLPSWLEDFLMKVWYTCSVATRSYYVKEMLLEHSGLTSENPNVDFSFHNFGDRGASCVEAAGFGGVAHLTCFKGTDNFNSLRYAHILMNEPKENIGFSIPASEHGSTTAWGKDGEFDMIDNHIEKSKGNPLMASVLDSYDIYNATDKVTSGKFKEKIESDEYPKFIERPDSGYAPDVIDEMLNIHEKNSVKFTTNNKGYKTFDKYGFIWGDGVEMNTMSDVLTVLRLRMYSAENMSFGSGGWLMQMTNRDTLGYAIKCSEITLEVPHYGWNGEELGTKTITREVYKDPITDSGKKSKKGKVTTYFNRSTNECEVDLVCNASMSKPEVLEIIIENGILVKEYSLSDVRKNVQLCLDNRTADIFSIK